MDEIEKKRRRAKLTRRKIVRYIKEQIKEKRTHICLNQFCGIVVEKTSRERLQADILKAGIPFNGWGYLSLGSLFEKAGWYIVVREE